MLPYLADWILCLFPSPLPCAFQTGDQHWLPVSGPHLLRLHPVNMSQALSSVSSAQSGLLPDLPATCLVLGGMAAVPTCCFFELQLDCYVLLSLQGRVMYCLPSLAMGP